MTSSYTGNCDAVNYFQIDAGNCADDDGDNLCDADTTQKVCGIQYAGGDISGISSSATMPTTGTMTGTWAIPTISSECYGKEVWAYAAGFYDSGPPPTTGISFQSNADVAGSVTGSFTFAECVSNDLYTGDANTNNDRSSQCPANRPRCRSPDLYPTPDYTCIVPEECTTNADCIPGECCTVDPTLPADFQGITGKCVGLGSKTTPAQYLCA